MADLGDAYVNIIPKAPGIKKNIEGLVDGSGAGESAGKSIGSGMVGGIKKILVAAGIGKIIKDAMSAGGDLEQSFGGLDTIYGEAAAGAKEYAQAAAQAGISANSYAEQAVSFGAALKQAYGGDTTAAMEAANTAIMDMADNSAKMGTDIGSIQAAYQGFAKQNYTMLDNLKLGYGGTKSEMERLLADAEALSGVHYDIDNLGDVYDAIHVVQENLGLTGVAAAEAGSTLTGSAAAMKASWQNLLAAMTTGEGLDTAMVNLGESAGNFAKNVLRMLGTLVQQLPKLLTGVFTNIVPSIIPVAGEMISGLIHGIISALPELSTAAITIMTELINGIITTLPQIAQEGITILTELANGILAAIPQLMAAATVLIPTLVNAIMGMLPQLITAGMQMLMGLINGIISALPQIASSAVTIIGQLVSGIASKLPTILESGITLLGELVAGVISAIPDLIAAIPQIFADFSSAMSGVDWPKLGKDIITGIIKGLWNAATGLFNAVRNIIQRALDAGNDEAEDGSPSRLFARELGQWIPKGVAMGIEQHASSVDEAMRDVISNAATGMDMAIQAGTAPDRGRVEIDYDRLAEAISERPVIIRGDTGKIFKVVKQANNKATRATGYNALAAAGV